MTRQEKKVLWMLSRKNRMLVLVASWLLAMCSVLWWGSTGNSGVMFLAVSINAIISSVAYLDWEDFANRLEQKPPAPARLVNPDTVKHIRAGIKNT